MVSDIFPQKCSIISLKIVKFSLLINEIIQNIMYKCFILQLLDTGFTPSPSILCTELQVSTSHVCKLHIGLALTLILTSLLKHLQF